MGDSLHETVIIGRVTRSHGLRGEMKVVPVTDRPEQFSESKSVFVQKDGRGQWRNILRCRRQGPMFVLQLIGVETREEADALRDATLEIDIKDRAPLEAGRYFVSDLIGLGVFCQSNRIGVVQDVLHNAAQDLLAVESRGREILIPMVSAFIRKIDLEVGRIEVDPIEGLLE